MMLQHDRMWWSLAWLWLVRSLWYFALSVGLAFVLRHVAGVELGLFRLALVVFLCKMLVDFRIAIRIGDYGKARNHSRRRSGRSGMCNVPRKG